MTIRNRTCIELDCDVCDYTFDEDEGVVHFDDLAEARRHLDDTNWFIGDDGIVLCGDDDEDHLAQARTWLDAGKLTADETAALCEVYPQLLPADGPGETDGQLGLAGIEVSA